MDVGSQEVCVIHWFKLDWFLVEPFISEFLDGWVVLKKFLENCKPVVHISFDEELVREVGVPQVVGSFPFEFPDNDRYAAQSG